MKPIVKDAFAVIGMEGSTRDGAGFIAALWDKANGRFGEVEALAARNADGQLCGVWGLMSDFSRSFRPWEKDFSEGLYLAGIECLLDAQPPAGWVKWHIPGFEYLPVPAGENAFRQGLALLEEKGLSLAGAVQDFTDPQTGEAFMLFPIRRL